MDGSLLAWIFFAAYVVLIGSVSWYNSRKPKTLQSFSVGNRDVNPFWIGLSLAANMTSTATFVINPGLVYTYGFAGFVGYAIASPLGIFTGLAILSKSFRKIGDRYSVISVPQWIGSRFGDKRMAVYLSVVSLLQVTFLTLIVVGLTVVMMNVLHIPMIAALVIIIAFTFTYMSFGGASAHVWTNSIQAIIKLVVAVILIASGIWLFREGIGAFWQKLSAVGPYYGDAVNPGSKLFRDYFEVVAANFIIGIAIVTQPHIISKSLFLRSEKDVNRYLLTAVAAELVFFSVLFVGLFARLSLSGAVLPPDRVMSTYMMDMFSPAMRSVIMLGILASGFSTMEGILLSLSTIFANDFYKNVVPMDGLSDEVKKKRLLKAGRIFMLALAPVTFILAYRQIVDPSLSVAIFAQNGVYGVIAATFAPVLFGIFSKHATKDLVFGASVTALIVHFGMYYGNITIYHNNPAVTASCGIVVSTAIVFIGVLLRERKATVVPI